jgi:ABC-type dipeptide/oligopeptide/nickel transport system permease subunit
MNTDPSAISGRATFQGPSVAHWLGTDGLGRDVLARLVWGGRVSLFGAAFATAVSLGIGVPLGLAAGFFRGWTDRVLARSGDILLSMPPVVVALALIAIVGTGTVKAMLVVGIIFAPRMFRLVRSVTLVAGEATHVEAARSMGIGQSRILWSHVLPRAMSALLVQISVVLSASLLAEASLSFLGLGVQPPSSSWGVMLNRALEDIARSGFQVFPPGVVMVVTLFSFNLIADALRDSLQSQRQER